MPPQRDAQDEIYTTSGPVTDYLHPHAVNVGLPTEEIQLPKIGEEFELDEAVLEAFPILGTKLKSARYYGSSKWGYPAKLETELPDGTSRDYFLKIIPVDNPGRQMCQGEFESLKAMHAVVPSFIPIVYKHGPLKTPPGHFLLTEFRVIEKQPADPEEFTQRVAELHLNSKSPNGKFGFHVPTFHGNLPSYNDWEDSWTVIFTKILARAMDIDQQKHGPWPEFEAVRKLLFDQVIPRLLDHLTYKGKPLKPSLVHGDLWDENCATDKRTGKPFTFDAGSLYAHNECQSAFVSSALIKAAADRICLQTRLITGSSLAIASVGRQISHHTRIFSTFQNQVFYPIAKSGSISSQPANDRLEDEWDARSILYPMRYNIGLSILEPLSGQRPVVLEDMKTLCKRFCPLEFNEIPSAMSEHSPACVINRDELESKLNDSDNASRVATE